MGQNDTSTTSTTGSYYQYDTSSTWTDNTDTSTWFYTSYRPRRILVENPKKWEEKDELAFLELVNCEVRTGWKIEMLIKGKTLITDPDIEIRSLKNFIPLLRWNATIGDNGKINEFLKKHPYK